MDAAGVRPARDGAQPRRATGSRTRAPLDNYPTADGKYVCIVAGSDANFARLCKAMDRPDLLDDPRFARLADRAAHGDTINGIVADWTGAARRGASRGPLRRARRSGRDRVHVGRHLRRPALRGPRRPRDRRRSRRRPDAPAGAVPAPRRRDPGRARGRAPPRRAHRRGAVDPARARRRRDRRRCARRASCEPAIAADPRRTVRDRPSDGRSRCIGGYSPRRAASTTSRCSTPARTRVATDVNGSLLSAAGDVVGVDRGHRRAARLQRPGAVRLRRRRARPERLRVITRSRESDPTTRVRPTDDCRSPVADELPDGDGVHAWAFA